MPKLLERARHLMHLRHYSQRTEQAYVFWIKHAVRMLSLGQLRKLDEWLHELIRKAEEVAREEKPSSGKQVIVDQTLENKTYRLESIRCGKEKCKCAYGKLHGPYWYSYIRVKDIVTSQYIGKKLPNEIMKKMKSFNKEQG